MTRNDDRYIIAFGESRIDDLETETLAGHSLQDLENDEPAALKFPRDEMMIVCIPAEADGSGSA